jgi:hypothetical protein
MCKLFEGKEGGRERDDDDMEEGDRLGYVGMN